MRVPWILLSEGLLVLGEMSLVLAKRRLLAKNLLSIYVLLLPELHLLTKRHMVTAEDLLVT